MALVSHEPAFLTSTTTVTVDDGAIAFPSASTRPEYSTATLARATSGVTKTTLVPSGTFLNSSQTLTREKMYHSATLLPDGRVLNEQLLAVGLARADGRFSHRWVGRFELIQQRAQDEALGLWARRSLEPVSLRARSKASAR